MSRQNNRQNVIKYSVNIYQSRNIKQFRNIHISKLKYEIFE